MGLIGALDRIFGAIGIERVLTAAAVSPVLVIIVSGERAEQNDDVVMLRPENRGCSRNDKVRLPALRGDCSETKTPACDRLPPPSSSKGGKVALIGHCETYQKSKCLFLQGLFGFAHRFKFLLLHHPVPSSARSRSLVKNFRVNTSSLRRPEPEKKLHDQRLPIITRMTCESER
jgi:hypothetical protein